MKASSEGREEGRLCFNSFMMRLTALMMTVKTVGDPCLSLACHLITGDFRVINQGGHNLS